MAYAHENLESVLVHYTDQLSKAFTKIPNFLYTFATLFSCGL